MRYITIIWFGIRLVVVIGIFVLIHDESDYLMMPLLSGVGAVLGSACAMVILFRHGVRLSLQPWSRIKACMAGSAPLFYSHGFASITDQGGTLIVGAILGKTELAYYNLAEKVIKLASSVCFNIGRTLYPNIANSRDKAFARRSTRLALVVGLVSSAAIAVSAEIVVNIIGGEKMQPAIPLLRLLSPYLIFAALGPILVNVLMFEERQKSIFTNTLLGGISYLAILGILVAFGKLTVAAVAIVFLLSIVIRVGHRYWIIRRAGLTDWLY